MGQNLAMNIASRGFKTSVFNRSYWRTEACVKKAKEEKIDTLFGYEHLEDFVKSIEKPRAVIIMVEAGNAVDSTIKLLTSLMEENDIIIDGGNEWWENTERRTKEVAQFKIRYMGMGVSGGEEGARHGPSIMPGGPIEAYKHIEPILKKIAAQVDDGPCVTHIGPGGAGNYVKMVHNGIEYGDMQLISEAYDLLKNIGQLTNDELRDVFAEWYKGPLSSYLIEITRNIFMVKEADGSYTVDNIVDKTGMKGTGTWTCKDAAHQGIAIPTIGAALTARQMSALLDERKYAASVLPGPENEYLQSIISKIDKKQLIKDVEAALYCAKICSYAQGMCLIKTVGDANNWNLDLGEISRIWKGGCIIRAVFLDRIRASFKQNPKLTNLLVDENFSKELAAKHMQLRSVCALACQTGIASPAFASSLAYYDMYRRARLPANLTQAQRDFFGAHTFKRLDKDGDFHCEWIKEIGKLGVAAPK
jgi:6-phosphogluconate dehydrogenase